MAVEIFPDSPTLVMSPRISFSYDLPQNDTVPIEQYIRSTSPSSSIDFDFCVFRESFDQDSSSADELFFDGKILPIEIKRRLVPPKEQAPPPQPPLPPPSLPLQFQESVNKSSVSIEKKNPGAQSEEKQSSNSKSWFKRSTSLNCGSGYGHTLCPLPLLSRSNSTGSTGSGKRSSISNNQKQSLLKSSAPNSSLKQSQSAAYSSKPPLKKSSYHGFYGNGVKSNHVLNVPPANLFGLGSIFSGGRDKSRKKVHN